MTPANLSPGDPAGAGNGAPLLSPVPGNSDAAAHLPGFAALDETARAALTGHGVNPLLSAATPLLVLVTRLRGLTDPHDLDGLRERVVQEIRQFETIAIQAGLSTDQIRVGRYALCATADDAIIGTPWGSRSDWSRRSLVTTLHHESWDGNRFFDLLEQMQDDPARYIQELELLYACLAVGFQGRYRSQPGDRGQLTRWQDTAYRLIRSVRAGDVSAERAKTLSPAWQGVADHYRPLRGVVPLWVWGAVLAAMLMFIYMALAYRLSGQADTVYRQLATLLPNRPVEIIRQATTQPPATSPPVQTAYSRLAAALAADTAAGQLQVIDQGSTGVLIRTRASVFISGSDTIEPAFAPVIDRVAKALATESGAVDVFGHTDAIPIRTLRFPSNQELSEARALAVANRLAQGIGGPQRLTAEGRGAGDPIASNDTPEGRQNNRRIDILLLGH